MSDHEWQKSSFSSGNLSGECLELAATTDAMHLRESDDTDVDLIASPTRLAALLSAIKAERLDRLR